MCVQFGLITFCCKRCLLHLYCIYGESLNSLLFLSCVISQRSQFLVHRLHIGILSKNQTHNNAYLMLKNRVMLDLSRLLTLPRQTQEFKQTSIDKIARAHIHTHICMHMRVCIHTAVLYINIFCMFFTVQISIWPINLIHYFI